MTNPVNVAAVVACFTLAAMLMYSAIKTKDMRPVYGLATLVAVAVFVLVFHIRPLIIAVIGLVGFVVTFLVEKGRRST